MRKRRLLPFLKWAGGKRWFVNSYSSFLSKSYHRYVEPFLGSGAVFFHLRPTNALLNDNNQSLIDTYTIVRSHPREIQVLLQRHHRLHSRTHYYHMRAEAPSNPLERAAQFIYLNRTCWNGLYRVNRKGEFNVPIGTRINVVLPTDDFEGIGKALNGVALRSEDFEQVIDSCGSGDFLFIDPPYTAVADKECFLRYNKGPFSWTDQLRLYGAICRAVERGAHFLLTNADDEALFDLYKDFPSRSKLCRPGLLSADSNFRKEIAELVVRSWA